MYGTWIGSGILATSSEADVECGMERVVTVPGPDGLPMILTFDCTFAGDVEVNWDDTGHRGEWACPECDYPHQMDRPEPDDDFDPYDD